MSEWYLMNDFELGIDLDNAMRPAPSKTGASRGPWIEVFFRRRLGDAIRAERLAVEAVYLDASNSGLHYHAIVRLARPMPLMERLAWQLRLGSDLMRGQADIMRAVKGIAYPTLLIRKTKMRDFYREPDRVCGCTKKHDTREQAELNGSACPVWKELRGLTPYELFGPTWHGNHRGVKLPLGNVPMEFITKIDERRLGEMQHEFEDIEYATAVSAEAACFQCGLPIFAGAKIVRAFWETGAAMVVFHRDCWQEENEVEA